MCRTSQARTRESRRFDRSVAGARAVSAVKLSAQQTNVIDAPDNKSYRLSRHDHGRLEINRFVDGDGRRWRIDILLGRATARQAANDRDRYVRPSVAPDSTTTAPATAEPRPICRLSLVAVGLATRTPVALTTGPDD